MRLFQGHSSVLVCKPPANGFEGQETFPIEGRTARGLILICIPYVARQDVIVCGQSRVGEGGQRVHCVGYSTGETAWLTEEEFAKLQLRNFIVLPKIRP